MKKFKGVHYQILVSGWVRLDPAHDLLRTVHLQLKRTMFFFGSQPHLRISCCSLCIQVKLIILSFFIFFLSHQDNHTLFPVLKYLSLFLSVSYFLTVTHPSCINLTSAAPGDIPSPQNVCSILKYAFIALDALFEQTYPVVMICLFM